MRAALAFALGMLLARMADALDERYQRAEAEWKRLRDRLKERQ